MAAFSNYGHDIDIAAPGVNVKSLSPGGGTITMSGTSMASPHVTGGGGIDHAQLGSAPSVRARLRLDGWSGPGKCQGIQMGIRSRSWTLRSSDHRAGERDTRVRLFVAVGQAFSIPRECPV